MTYIPYLSTIITFVFTVAVFNRYRQRGGAHLLLWAVGLLFYGLGTLSEVILSLTFNAFVLKIWYLTGAMLTAAWLGMAGWMALAVASLVELVWRHPLAGIAARASAGPGAVFTAICLITGSLWGRPAWGTWWVWDGRLTSMLVLLFLYFAYIALAEAAESSGGGQSRLAAIFGLVGAVNIPIIHYSVLWWNSLHQPPSIAMGQSAMAPVFLYGLLAVSLGFSLIFGGVVLARMRTILANRQADARLRRRAMEHDFEGQGNA